MILEKHNAAMREMDKAFMVKLEGRSKKLAAEHMENALRLEHEAMALCDETNETYQILYDSALSIEIKLDMVKEAIAEESKEDKFCIECEYAGPEKTGVCPRCGRMMLSKEQVEQAEQLAQRWRKENDG